MDPNENLKRQREIIHELTAGEVLDRLDDPYARELVGELVELVQALDSWLCRGGFSPSGWTVVATAARGRMGHGD